MRVEGASGRRAAGRVLTGADIIYLEAKVVGRYPRGSPGRVRRSRRGRPGCVTAAVCEPTGLEGGETLLVGEWFARRPHQPQWVFERASRSRRRPKGGGDVASEEKAARRGGSLRPRRVLERTIVPFRAPTRRGTKRRQIVGHCYHDHGLTSMGSGSCVATSSPSSCQRRHCTVRPDAKPPGWP